MLFMSYIYLKNFSQKLKKPTVNARGGAASKQENKCLVELK